MKNILIFSDDTAKDTDEQIEKPDPKPGLNTSLSSVYRLYVAKSSVYQSFKRIWIFRLTVNVFAMLVGTVIYGYRDIDPIDSIGAVSYLMNNAPSFIHTLVFTILVASTFRSNMAVIASGMFW